ncbi:MAG TPA: hypothetical protein VG433_06150 [Pirellulales bacterium]|nr:hypothetical protein [Pirellulales bacterium]
MVVVLVILAALAGLLLPLFGSLAFQSSTNATKENLRRLQELIINRHRPDMQGMYLASVTSPGANPDGLPRAAPASPPQLRYLFLDPNTNTTSAGYNPSTGLGWNGPYALSGQGTYPGMNSDALANGFVSGAFGTSGDPIPLDAWGNPIVIVPIQDNTLGGPSQGQYYYVLISAGSTGSLGTAVAAYGATQGPYTSTQYTGTSGGTIWAVATPLPATVTSTSSTAASGSSSLDSASYGPTLTTTSDNATYQYWLPLK